MGLFGYSEKDFEKNKQVIKDKVSNMIEMVLNRFGGDNLKSASVLNSLIGTIEGVNGGPVKYPKSANKKEMEAIDQRIFKLVETLERDLQERSQVKFSEHLKMLSAAIVECRPYGKELFSANDLDTQEKMANILGNIQDNLNKKEKFVKERDQYLAKAQQLMKEGKKVEAEKLNPYYQSSLQQIAMLDKMVTALSAQYNQALKVVEARSAINIANELKANQIVTGSAADFQREIAQGNAALSKELDKISQITDIAVEGVGDIETTMQQLNTGASITSDAEAANAASMDFSSAQYTSSSSEAPSILDAISKNN